VTDVVMPRMNGHQLADQLSPIRPSMKTLFISGYMDEAVKFEADRRFLHKPFTPLSLARKVREVLDEPGSP
jgi:two-component system cell cycle sensor histidine kinase/response regulator CckA